jgi:hypothetical protein
MDHLCPGIQASWGNTVRPPQNNQNKNKIYLTIWRTSMNKTIKLLSRVLRKTLTIER